jgi:glycosyltransferase involved in cell wall biosynthesis
MMMTVVNVAYPLAPVHPDTAGGAEQVLAELDSALVRAGHRSIVIACDGSRTAGELVTVPRPPGQFDPHRIEQAQERHHRALCDVLQRHRVDLVHMHGVDFHAYLPPSGVPVLATLHLPIAWYSSEALRPRRSDTWLNCVSATQQAACPPSRSLLPPIENGVPPFCGRHAKRAFALMLARICPEKGVHIAIDAAKRAGVPLLIAGEVFPYPDHQHYFAEEVQPRLDRWRRFIGPVSPARKRRLLAAARCLLVASLVPETSSLAAREALSSGTPVVGFARGALADIIETGRTGFLVDTAQAMADAIGKAASIDPEACRRVARERFPLQPMIDRYFSIYAKLVATERWRREIDAA